MAEVERMEFSASLQRQHERQAAVRLEIEREARARQVVVPTQDRLVKRRLRELGQAICLFGENEHQRRMRLRDYMQRNNITQGHPVSLQAEENQEAAPSSESNEPFYTEGTVQLKAARREIARYSLRRAKKRLSESRAQHDALSEKAAMLSEKKDEMTADEVKKLMQEIVEHRVKIGEVAQDIKKYTNSSSQIGDKRPVPCIRFAPDSKHAATASWSGMCKLWEVGSTKCVREFKGHTERVNDLCFFSDALAGRSPSVANLASGAADNTVKIWSLESSAPLASLDSHVARVTRVRVHPSDRFLGSASCDMTWRLWDAETHAELLIQEGHSRAVTGLAFQCDGALAASSSVDASCKVWDLRTGRDIATLQGHVKMVVDVAFSPNGYTLATGSDDHTIRVWDLRKKKCIYTIPAHTRLVSSVCFQPGSGYFLASASFDRTVKIWNTSNWQLEATLLAHEEKVMCVDVAPDSSAILTSGYDRTWKTWHKAE